MQDVNKALSIKVAQQKHLQASKVNKSLSINDVRETQIFTTHICKQYIIHWRYKIKT